MISVISKRFHNDYLLALRTDGDVHVYQRHFMWLIIVSMSKMKREQMIIVK